MSARSLLSTIAAVVLGLNIFGCKTTSSPEKTPADGGTKEGPASSFTLTSSAFKDGGKIPAKYGCGQARNYKKPSIPLQWSDPPKGTKSFVLLMDDLHPVANQWVHWLVVDIPADTRSLAEGASGKAMPAGAKELNNTWGEKGYGGPCPPSGTHTYRIRIFARPTATTTLKPPLDKGGDVAAQLSDSLGVAEIRGDFP